MANVNAMTSFPNFRSNIEQSMKLGARLKEKQKKEEPNEGILNRQKIVDTVGGFFGIKGAAASYAVNKTMDMLEKEGISNMSDCFRLARKDMENDQELNAKTQFDREENAAQRLTQSINLAYENMQNRQAQNPAQRMR